MKINAQEVLLSNSKFGKKKMGEEPTSDSQEQTNALKDEPATNPQEPKAYSIMDAMDLQSRNNINFSASRKIKDVPTENPQEPSGGLKDEPATNPQEPKAYSIMDAMDLQGRNNVNFGSLLRKMGEEPTTEQQTSSNALKDEPTATSEGEEAKQMYSTNLQDMSNVSFQSRETLIQGGKNLIQNGKTFLQKGAKKFVLPPLTSGLIVFGGMVATGLGLQGCTEGALFSTNQVVNVNLDLSAITALLEEYKNNSVITKEQLDKMNELLAQILAQNNAQTELLKSILNSNLSSEEKLAKIMDMLGDFTTMYPQYIAQLKNAIDANTQAINNNGAIAHQDAMNANALLTLISQSLDGLSNFAAVELYNILTQMQGDVSNISTYTQQAAMYLKGIRQELKHDIPIIINKLDSSNMNQQEIINQLDLANTYDSIMVEQNNQLINALKNGQGKTIAEIATDIGLTQNRMMQILEDIYNGDVKIDVNATLTQSQIDEITAKIEANTEELQNISEKLNELYDLLEEWKAMDDHNSAEAIALLQEISDKIDDIECTCDCNCGSGGNEGWDVNDLFG